jgi:aldehyde dehydrogenase (NAD+)
MGQLLPVVNEFLETGPLSLFVGGEWKEAAGRSKFETRDPGSSKVLAEVAAAQKEDVSRAVTAAREAFKKSGWATMAVNDRAVILHRLADLIDKHRDVIAQIESLDVGKPLAQAKGFDIPFAAQTYRYYADLAVHTRRREPIALSQTETYTLQVPYGVCAFIFPWNFPFLLLAWGAAPALAAGNTVVVKPAEETPLSTLYFAKLAEQAGVPAGVVNVVPGYGETAGSALASHPGIQRMSFTGSPEVGRDIAAKCGANLVPVKLELGGKGAAVVFDDVDVKNTAEALAAAVTLNTGQVCCTATRWFVHRSVWDRFVDHAKAALGNLKIGYGLAEDTQMGPVVSAKQKQRVLGYLEKGAKEGATSLLPGGEADVAEFTGGYFVKPALLTGPAENICVREEIFGPVAYLVPFAEEDEAVDLVNRSSYGLANSVWSADLDRARRVAEQMVAGNSWINAHNIFKHGLPYGGCNLSGFGGGVLGPDTLADYLRRQSIVRPTA